MEMENRKKAIDKIYRRRDRIDMPDFQREEVWPVSKKRKLIDTILKGWHIPKFYFRMLDDGSLECVDGQQRLSAIFEFFDDILSLDSDMTNKYKASKYNELSDEMMDKFDDYEIDIEEIKDASEFELEELFQRLQLGTPLNTAEKLNAISGELRDFCQDATKKSFFKDKVVLKNTRYAYFEIMVRWIYLEARGIQSQMRFSQFESFLKENRSFSNKSETAKKIIKSLLYLKNAFSNDNKYLRNKANILSLCMLSSRIVLNSLNKSNPEIFGKFVEDFFKKLAAEIEKGNESWDKELLRYQQAITSDSMGGDSIKTRINILTKRLATFSNSFSSLVGNYKEIDDEVTKNISELVLTFKDLIYKVNEKFSSKSGENLFKLSNKVVKSLNNLSIPCRDLDRYKDFIDMLYFIIYEGSGNCKRFSNSVPEIVMDIKKLRTLNRHDIDHGKTKDIKKKNIKIADVFEKHSGKRTPVICSPEDFLTLQIRLLYNLISFIESLLK